MRLLPLLCFVIATATVIAESRPSATAVAPPVAPNAPIRIVLDGARRSGECAAEGERLNQELRTLHFPPGWTLAIMCTPVRWQAILEEADVRNTDAAFTRISERITVLNGDIFRSINFNYRHILAHELGHITCNCAEEGKVEEIAHKLEKKQ